MTNPSPEQIEAAAVALYNSRRARLGLSPMDRLPWSENAPSDRESARAALVAAAGVTPQEPSLDEYREGYEAWKASGKRMHGALRTIWKMCEPHDTSHMTFGEDPQEVVRSVRAALAAPVQVELTELAQIATAEIEEFEATAGPNRPLSHAGIGFARAVYERLRGGGQ